MTPQILLKTIKTAKSNYPFSVYKLLLSSSSINQCLDSPKQSLSDLNLSTFRRILSDPDVKSWKCVSLFRFILHNPCLFSFQPDLRTHLSLAFRVLSKRRFSDAKEILKPVAIDDILRYPFRAIVSSFVDECGCETKAVARFFNSMLMVYSDNGKFDEVVEVFEYMKNNEIKIDENNSMLMVLDRFCNFNQIFDEGLFVKLLLDLIIGLCVSQHLSTSCGYPDDVYEKSFLRHKSYLVIALVTTIRMKLGGKKINYFSFTVNKLLFPQNSRTLQINGEEKCAKRKNRPRDKITP